MSSESPLGRFAWYELMTVDADAAIPFYTKVMGWGTSLWKEGYTMWTANEVPLGGMMKLPQEASTAGAPPHWLGYVSTPNVDATTKQAVGLGAKVLHEPTDIPDVGRFAVLADPQGAVFAVYASATASPDEETPPKPGHVSWHELATTNFEAAFGFYNKLFGWEKTEAMDMGPAGIYQMYGRKGIPLGGMFNKPKEMPGPPFWLYYVLVDDVHRVVEVVKKNGGKILNGPMEVPGGDWIAQCMDPQGAAFAIHSKASK